jgi:hypothetical protein
MSTVTDNAQTEQLTEEDMVTRTEVNASCVALITLEAGDTFETDDASGTVVWKVNHGSAKAVEVLFEGHTTPMSIAPSLLVRKTGSVLEQTEQAAPSVPVTAPPVVPVVPVVVPPVVEPVVEVLPTVEAVVEVPPTVETVEPVVEVPPTAEAVVEPVVEVPPVVVEPVVEALPTAEAVEPVVEPVVEVPPTVEAVVEPVVQVPPVVATPAPAPVVRPVIVRVVPVAMPVASVTAAKPKAAPTSTAPAVVATQAATDLTPEQVAALPSTVTASLRSLFTYGLLNGWSKGSYWLCTQKYFPSFMAGKAYKSCCDQINLYRSELRKQGKLK